MNPIHYTHLPLPPIMQVGHLVKPKASLNPPELPVPVVTKAESFTIKTTLKHLQVEARSWLIQRETNPYQGHLHGGFFADHAGMGKTLSLISAIQAQPGPRAPQRQSVTLIVVPSSVIQVWVNQFLEHTDLPRSRIVVYHGPDRSNCGISEDTLVVVTSYGILRNECLHSDTANNDLNAEMFAERRFRSDSIFNWSWYRVILDEAHLAKNRKSRISLAITHLNTKIKWVVTATPLINSLDDDFSYFRFLGLVKDWGHWRSFVPNTQDFISDRKKEQLGSARDIFRSVKGEILLQRPKSALRLPPKREIRESIEFTPAEKRFYNSLVTYSLNRIQTIEDTIQDEGFRQYARAMGTCVLALIHRLKMATNDCHFVLETMSRLKKKDVKTIEEAAEIIDYYNVSKNCTDECPVCRDEDADEIAPCGHKLCSSCWKMCLERSPNCPSCRRVVPFTTPVKNAPTRTLGGRELEKAQFQEMDQNYGLGDSKMSTKIRRMMELIDKNIGKTKLVISSHSLQMLDCAQKYIEQKYPQSTLRIDGSVSLAERHAHIKTFQEGEDKRVMLMSLTCSPEGITLIRATILIHLDQWWNKTGKVAQINDRIHRIGQDRPTKIYYLSIAGTIESRIHKLQDRKESIINYKFDGAEIKPQLLAQEQDQQDQQDQH